VILDVTTPSDPQYISHINVGDLGKTPVACHSAVPIPARNLLVINSEPILEGREEVASYALIVDISNEQRPRILSSLPMPLPAAELPYGSYFDKGGRFGPHNQHHYQENPAAAELLSTVLLTYFNAGLRIYDISDAHDPREVAHYVPTDPLERLGLLPRSALVTQFEDVAVDRRGYIYCTDKNAGLFVLRADLTLT
jgi:hypothetical protein